MAQTHSSRSSALTHTQPRFEVAHMDGYTRGRNGLEGRHNEDCVTTYMTDFGPVLVAIDGITPLTDWRSHSFGEEITAGRLAAELCITAATRMRPLSTLDEFLAHVSLLFEITRKEEKIPENEILGAVGCLFIPWIGEHGGFWQLGDCGWGYSRTVNGKSVWTDSLQGKLTDNSRDANARAEFIEDLMRQNGQTYTELDDAALGQLAEQGWKHMRAQRIRNSDYSWLRSFEGLKSWAESEHLLTAPVDRLVVVSDGWECVPQTLNEGLQRVLNWRRQDKLMIGRNTDRLRTPKGFVAFDGTVYPNTDDVAMAWAEFRAAV